MSTKVKGDKIKEGSIPLSALDDSLNATIESKIGLKNYVGNLTLDTPINFNRGMNNIAYTMLDGQVIPISLDNGAETDIPYAPPFIVECVVKYPSVTLSINSQNPTHQQVKLPIFLGINKITNEVLDDNAIPTPDWNAQTGEAGFIENKPFYTEGDIRQIDVNGEYNIDICDVNIGDKINISWDLDYPFTNEKFQGSASFVIQEGVGTYYYKDNFNIEFYDNCLHLYAHGASESHYGKVTVIVNGEFKTIEEKYIPDTVLKTTPQTLSDADKNQVKENLGISTPATPDWNAQEGEAGYIENKPVYGGNVIRTVGSNVIMSPTSFTINHYYRAKLVSFRYYNSDGEYTNIDFDLNTNFGSTIVGDGFEMYVSYNINYLNATIEFRELTLNGGWVQFFVDEYDMLKTLDNKYLPDTVIKTTPQSLSTDDKNQALTNLGIPRVINADFYRIGGDMTIDELSEILGDCVTNEILIQGLCYRTEHCTVYLPTLHQSYIKDGGGKVLSKLVCGQYRIDEEAYDTELIVYPSIYIQYDEDSQLYTCLLEEY